MKIKRLFVLLLSVCLVIPQVNLVKAEENMEDSNLDFSCSGYVYNVEKGNYYVTDITFNKYLYDSQGNDIGQKKSIGLNSYARELNNKIIKPGDAKATVANKSADKSYANVSVEIADAKGKTDLEVKEAGTKLHASGSMSFKLNFKRTDIEPGSYETSILIKDKEDGGKVIKTIPVSYSTPGYRDEHNISTSQWSGSYYYFSGVGTTKNIGTIDYAQSKKTLKVTYKNAGTSPVLKFTLDPSGYFTFSNGKYEYYGSSSANKVGGTNTLNLVVKSKFKSDFSKLVSAGKLDYVNNSMAAAMLSELLVVYNDAYDANGNRVPGVTLDSHGGCIEGGGISTIPLSYYVSLKPLGIIKTKTASRKTSSIKVSWNKLNGVSGYRIYRSTKKNSGYKYLKQVSSKTTSYTNKKLKSGKTYYYKVRAYSNVFGDRYYGAYSSPLKSGTRPAKPKVTAKRKGRRLKIKYKKISGASGYRIYIRTGKKGRYKRVKQYTSGKKVSYTSKKLKRKKTYYVKVRAYKTINGKKYFGSYSKAKKMKIR